MLMGRETGVHCDNVAGTEKRKKCLNRETFLKVIVVAESNGGGLMTAVTKICSTVKSSLSMLATAGSFTGWHLVSLVTTGHLCTTGE